MAGKIKFDQEAAFKSIIGVSAGAPAAEEKKAVEAPAARPTGKGRPKADRETKKRVTLALFPSTYGDLQKIAYMKRQSASDLCGCQWGAAGGVPEAQRRIGLLVPIYIIYIT